MDERLKEVKEKEENLRKNSLSNDQRYKARKKIVSENFQRLKLTFNYKLSRKLIMMITLMTVNFFLMILIMIIMTKMRISILMQKLCWMREYNIMINVHWLQNN